MFPMILEDSSVDLIGFIDNIWHQGYGVYFTVSCKEVANEVYMLYQNEVPCVVQFSKDKKEQYKHFNQKIMRGQLIRIQGKVIKVTPKDHIALVTNYHLLETRVNTFARIKKMKEKEQIEKAEELEVCRV